MKKVFEFSDYKAYLLYAESERTAFQRGFRSRLAETLACQNAYVSQVLNTDSNFSLEQGLKLARFLELSEVETRYFVLLIEFARAGTSELRELFRKDISAIQHQHLNIGARVESVQPLTLEDQALYYSSWIYPTIHLLVGLPEIRSATKIAQTLGLDLRLVQGVLDFLLKAGLILDVGGQFRVGPTQIHLGRESSLIRQHHTNWRIRAIDSLMKRNQADIHYSTVSSLSKQDAEKLRFQFVQMIEAYVRTVGHSKEEELFNFNLDFYSLI